MGLLLLGCIVGAVLVMAFIYLVVPRLMFQEVRSPLGFAETVEKIQRNIASAGAWGVVGVTEFSQSIEKHGAGSIAPMTLIKFCHPHYAYSILRHDEHKLLSALMPCTISVYQKGDGVTYISRMNIGLMGRMFRGIVKETMVGKVAKDDVRFLDLG